MACQRYVVDSDEAWLARKLRVRVLGAGSVGLVVRRMGWLLGM